MPETATLPARERTLQTDRKEGEDAICFVAGLQGIHFSAGVIHAYLAADRKPPVAVAGISGGALSTAAMYAAYRELLAVAAADADCEAREAARWVWFRRYVEHLTINPLDPIWDAIPNPVDFFAETIPVEDLSCPSDLKDEETEARLQYHRLIRLGNWVAGLTVTVGDVADLIVRRVRWQERYAVWQWQALLCILRGVWIALKVALQLAIAPRIAWFTLVQRQAAGSGSSSRVRPVLRPKPLFGYTTWLISCAWLSILAASIVAAAAGWPEGYSRWWALAIVAAALVAPGCTMFGLKQIHGPLLKPLGIEKGLLHKYHMKRWLRELFGDLTIEAPQQQAPGGDGGGGPFHALIVAAVVNQIDALLPSAGQLWARPNRGVKVRDAVMAALAEPGLFEPEQPADPQHWLTKTGWKGLGDKEKLTLIDGHTIGSNPLPAFFNWVAKRWAKTKHRGDIEKLFTTEENAGAALRVVYSVPIEPLSRENEVKRESLNIIETGLTSLALQRRRDTEMEGQQTAFISSLEFEIRQARERVANGAAGGGQDDGEARFPIFPVPISPEQDLSYENVLDPQRNEGLRHMAAGCRRTLESIYRERLATEFREQKEASCPELLVRVAAGRNPASIASSSGPGMMEVCGQCSRRLQIRPAETSTIDTNVHSYGVTGPPHRQFPHLVQEDRGRIVFLANGGVFRGSFHIGVAAALRAAGVKPDLVVGSSVGAIIGAAVSCMSQIEKDDDAYAYLRQLTRVFLECDKRVALTRTLKSVAKQLGVRGRSIGISPRSIRSMVRRGSQGDASYALAGAPSALTDALSDLFLLPHNATQRIAAKFVAGHITDAVKLFGAEVQKETLRRLSIENWVMGSELLEQSAADLLFPKQGGAGAAAATTAAAAKFDRFRVQPYLNSDGGDPVVEAAGTAFFATATHLSRRATLLLGRDFPTEVPSPARFDFLEECLSSSAFPVVFAPRAVSALFPGRGRTDTLLCDGGIFDNLPFFPAIGVLSELQESYGKEQGPGAHERLRKRQESPALLIAAGLDPDARRMRRVPEDMDMVTMSGLAGTLSHNVKIRSFESSSKLVYRMTNRFLEAYECDRERLDRDGFADGIVPAAVLKIIPADAEHLNGTFAFCRATGLDQKRMQLSIAHGCFQTLGALAGAGVGGAGGSSLVLTKALAGCASRIRRVEKQVRRGVAAGAASAKGMCPFYVIDGARVECPFHRGAAGVEDVRGVYERCVGDPQHGAGTGG